jgi:hypothetical protein
MLQENKTYKDDNKNVWREMFRTFRREPNYRMSNSMHQYHSWTPHPQQRERKREGVRIDTNSFNSKSRKVKSNPITGLDRPWGFQDVEDPRFQDNRQMKAVRLSALRCQLFITDYGDLN